MGWGASTLVSTADDVVSGTGKFEQLEVCCISIIAFYRFRSRWRRVLPIVFKKSILPKH